MFRRCTIRGAEAVIKWGYHRAARLGSWVLTSEGQTGTLTGTVVEADDFKLQQPVLTFLVPRQNASAWTWPIESLHIVDGQITARLRLQE